MKLKQYIYSQLSVSFFSIFLGLFFITSNIFLVRIATLTSVITLNFIELSILFIYSIPSILFYTLPISFFMALIIGLAKLSSEYELIIITSFGLNPQRVFKILFPITLITSISLLIISLELIPKTKFLTEEFLNVKKREANFNIKASEYGQKFDEWMIYIDNKKDNIYEEVRLFKTANGVDEFIVSKSAIINNQNGQLNFELSNGKAFRIENGELNQIDFKTMIISQNLENKEIENFTTSFNYWKNLFNKNSSIEKFSFNILISIFPLISLYLVLLFGYYNPRYDKNRSVAFGVLSIVVFYIVADYLTKNIYFHSLYVVPLLWIVCSYYLFSKKTKTLY